MISYISINVVLGEFRVDQLNSLLANYTPKIDSFLLRFEHRLRHDQPAIDILRNESYWIKSIPHDRSGPCFTYNPLIESDPGFYYAMTIEPKIDAEKFESERRTLFNNLRVFLHEPKKFFFFKEEEAPNNIAIDFLRMQFTNRTRIVGKAICHKHSIFLETMYIIISI